VEQQLEQLYANARGFLDEGDIASVVAMLADEHPSLIADLFRSLEAEERVALVRALDSPLAAAVLCEIDDRGNEEVLSSLSDDEVVDLLDHLPSDDAADLVAHVADEAKPRILELLDRVDHQDAVELKELLRYPEDSAGGLMAKEYLSVREDQSISAVLPALRQLEDDDLTSMQVCFVVDRDHRLVGQIPLLRLLLSDRGRKASELMDEEPVVAHVDDDQEEVANLFLSQDLLSLPIVDHSRRLVGRITVDDAMDVLSEEASEDVVRMAGSSAVELGETSTWRISRARLPWLALGLGGELVAAYVLSHFERNLQDRVILAFFIPLIVATGGNTGIQTSAIMIRRLVMREFDSFRARRALARELTVGLVNGMLLGGVMVGVLYLWQQQIDIGLVIGLALVAVVLLATITGSMVPLMLDRMGIDPTVATGPFITTTNDIIGLLVYLGIAHWLLASV
jgi:magnesium transporter